MNAPVNNAQQSKAVVLQPPSMPMPDGVASEYGLTGAQWRVLVDQLFPSAKSSEAIIMAVTYCRARNLDIFKKPVHIVPMYSSQLKRNVETVWPGIAEIRTTATRTREYAGIDEVVFGPMIEREFKGVVDEWDNGRKTGSKTIQKKVRFPEWASVVVYRWVQGHKAAFHTKIFWEETYATIGKTEVPNDTWERRPRGQFDKCVEAAALRKAFPEEVGSMYAAEEMEGRVLYEHEPIGTMPPPPPPPPATRHAAPQGRTDVNAAGSVVDAEIVEDDQAETSSQQQEAMQFTDPDEVIKDAETRFACVKDEAEFEELRVEFAHLQENWFPPDWEKLVDVMSRNFDRVTAKTAG